MIEDYFRQLDSLLASLSFVHSSRITYDKRSTHLGFVRGDIFFLDGSLLHLREFVNVQHGIEHYMYVYHYQSHDGEMVFRYDNAPHFPGLPNFPHHKHEGNELNVVPATPPDLQAILIEIQGLLATPTS